jgi:hypothetical protein
MKATKSRSLSPKDAPELSGRTSASSSAAARSVAADALPTWACMEALAAEALSALPDAAGETSEDEAQHSGPVRVANACVTQGLVDEVESEPAPVSVEVPPLVRALLDGLDSADAFELDARLRQIVAREQHVDAELAPLLRRLPHLGERAGLSARKMRALVRLDRAGDRCPALREAFRAARCRAGRPTGTCTTTKSCSGPWAATTIWPTGPRSLPGTIFAACMRVASA